VERGSLDVVVEGADGRERTLGRFGPGGLFGEVSFLLGGGRSASVRAHERRAATVVRFQTVGGRSTGSRDGRPACHSVWCRAMDARREETYRKRAIVAEAIRTPGGWCWSYLIDGRVQRLNRTQPSPDVETALVQALTAARARVDQLERVGWR
jgi:hypothetical protein